MNPIQYFLIPKIVTEGGTGGTVDLGDVPATLAEILTKVNSIGTSKITVMSPTLANGNARIVRGGDYAISEGRSLDFDLTGAFILSIRDSISSMTFTVENALSLLNVTHETIADGVRVRVELTSAQTLALKPSSAGLQINAIMGNSHSIPLLQGTLTVDKAIVSG